MSSNIPVARSKLSYVLENWHSMTSRMRKKMIADALAKMKRAPAIKKAKRGKRMPITKSIRIQVRKLARAGLNNHNIAERVGLSNGGRVSEILNGKR